jgi:hypothetical protein
MILAPLSKYKLNLQILGKFDVFIDFMVNDAGPALNFNSEFENKLNEFDEKFNEAFPIDYSNMDDIKKNTKMAKSALSR